MGSRIRGKIFHFQPAKIISPTLTEEIVLTNWLWLAHRVHWSAQHWTLWEFVLICQRTNWTRVENQTSLGLFCCRCCRVWSGRVTLIRGGLCWTQADFQHKYSHVGHPQTVLDTVRRTGTQETLGSRHFLECERIELTELDLRWSLWLR